MNYKYLELVRLQITQKQVSGFIYVVYKKHSLSFIYFMVVDYLTPSGVVFFKDRKH